MVLTLSTSICIVGLMVSDLHESRVSRISHALSNASPVNSIEKEASMVLAGLVVVVYLSCRSNIVTIDDRLVVSPSRLFLTPGELSFPLPSNAHRFSMIVRIMLLYWAADGPMVYW